MQRRLKAKNTLLPCEVQGALNTIVFNVVDEYSESIVLWKGRDPWNPVHLEDGKIMAITLNTTNAQVQTEQESTSTRSSRRSL